LIVHGGKPQYQFNWSNSESTQDILQLGAGTYSVTVNDANGCKASLAQVVVGEPSALDLQLAIASDACAGNNNGKLVVNVVGGVAPYKYEWSDHENTAQATHLAPGNYTITVTDANGCKRIMGATVNTYPGVSANISSAPLPCANARGTINITEIEGTAPYSYHWSNGATTQNISNINPGTYHVTIQDAHGCDFDTTIVVENLNSFEVHASGGGTITMGQTVELHATSSGSNQTVYTWSPSHTLSCAECASTIAQPGQSILYTVTGIDQNGCTASDTVSVDVIEDHTIFTPNAFSPNDDGNNDYFQLYGNLAGIHSLNIAIFDRWGEKIFESDDVNFRWDGTYKGEKVGPTVVVYVMKITFLDGRDSKLLKGSITVVR
jgi:gliding motility-associated-like protein